MRRLFFSLRISFFSCLLTGIVITPAPAQKIPQTAGSGVQKLPEPGTNIRLSGTTIPESIRPGQQVARITSSASGGSSRNSQWHYILVDDGQGHFSLRDSLLITSKDAHFNYESRKVYHITIRAFNDEGQSGEQTFTIHITDVNEPPAHIRLSNNSVLENSPSGTLIGMLSAVDPDSADQVHFSLIGDSTNARYQINGSRLEVKSPSYFNYEAHHRVSIFLRATDKSGAYKDSTVIIRLINQDDAPVAIHLVPDHIRENAPDGTLIGRLYTTDEDSADTFRYTLLADADGRFSLSPDGRAIVTADSTRLDYESHRSFTLRLRSVDAGGKSVVDSVHVHLENVNEPPLITGLHPLETREDHPADTLWFRVSDPESKADSLTVRVRSGNTRVFADSGLTSGGKDGSRWVSATPLPDSSGNAGIIIDVSDGKLTTSRQVPVNVTPVNDAPRLVHNNMLRLREGGRRVISPRILSFADVDNPPSQLRYRIDRLPVHGRIFRDSVQLYEHDTFTQADINQRRIRYRHDGSETTHDKFTLDLNDGSGADIPDITEEIKIRPVNDPPIISRLPAVEVLEDHPSPIITFSISDAETPATYLQLRAFSSNHDLLPNANIHLTGIANTRTVQLTPLPNANGTARVKLILSDGTAYTTRSFLFKVIPVNDPPVLSTIGSRTFNEDDTLKVGFSVTDIESSASALKTWITTGDKSLIPQNNLSITGSGNDRTIIAVPKPNQNGKTLLTLYASDGDSVTTEPFEVTVKPVNDPPEPFALYGSDIYVDIDTLAITFNWEKAQDIEHDPITYTLHIQGEKVDTTISDITRSRYIFTNKHLLQANDVYKWWVDASDGHSVTSCYIQQQFTAPKIPMPPHKYALFPNYPNPFNPTTQIRYQIPVTSHVTLSVYDMLGRKVASLVDQQQAAGQYEVSWNASSRASGIYIYQLVALGVDHSRYVKTKKMLLVK